MDTNPITQLTGYFMSTNEYILVLLFFLFSLVIYAILEYAKIFGENKAVNVIVSISIGLLSVFFLNEQLINLILTPYNVIGTLVLFAIPFLILLYLTHKTYMSSIFRKIIWGVFTLFLTWLFYKQYWPISWPEHQTQIILVGIGVAMIILDDIIHKMFKRK